MKLSALCTWIVVVAFAMVTTTSATSVCNITLSTESGCGPDDMAEIVALLNLYFEQDPQSKGKGRDLNEQQDAALRGTHAQEERELCSSFCLNGKCDGNNYCNYMNCQGCGCYPTCRRDRELQGKSSAAKFGQLIRDVMGTFDWDGCKPKDIGTMDCTDV